MVNVIDLGYQTFAFSNTLNYQYGLKQGYPPIATTGSVITLGSATVFGYVNLTYVQPGTAESATYNVDQSIQ